MISVVMPTLNAAAHLPRSLPPLAHAAAEGVVRDLVISDGGSGDATLEIADSVGATIVRSEKGRGRQLRAGAAAAKGDWLLFLHADTALEEGWAGDVAEFMRSTPRRDMAAVFRLGFDDNSRQARRVAWWAGVRGRLLGLPYGDQGLLLSKHFYDSLGGYADIPLMEDVDIIRRIGRRRLTFLKSLAVTSAERYHREGYGRRARRNLILLARYFMGADPVDLARDYE